MDFSLASLGIGSATVDTKLANSKIRAGEILRGVTNIYGGRSNQSVDAIYLYIITQYSKGDKKVSYEFEKIQLTDGFVIEAEEEKQIPFEFSTPIDLPRSTGHYPIYIKTGIDIPMAIDPTDRDRIQILPPPLVSQLLQYIEDAGFVLYAVKNQYDAENKPHPFFQSYQFKPSGRFHGYVDRLDVVFDVTDADIYVEMEVIRDQSVLGNTFYWKYAQPVDSFMLNGQHLSTDPITAIKDYLNKE